MGISYSLFLYDLDWAENVSGWKAREEWLEDGDVKDPIREYYRFFDSSIGKGVVRALYSSKG